MKMLKHTLIILLLLSLLSISVCAEHLPEENIIGRDMIIEKDSNVVKDNIEMDKNPEYVPKYDALHMTKTVFFKKFIRPSIIILASSIAVFSVVSVIEHKKSKRKTNNCPV